MPLVLLVITLAACQTNPTGQNSLNQPDEQSELNAPVVASEIVGGTSDTIVFSVPAVGSKSANDIRNGALLAYKTLSVNKISLAFVNDSIPQVPNGRNVRLIARLPGTSLPRQDSAIEIAISDRSFFSDGFAFLASNMESLEAGLRQAAPSGEPIVVFVDVNADAAAVDRLKVRLGGAVQAIPYNPSESVSKILDRINKLTPAKVFGFTGTDQQIVRIVQGIRRTEPNLIIVGHQGWTARLTSQTSLNGAVIALPDSSNYNLIRQAYVREYGLEPSVMSVYGFDIVAVAAGIIRTQGPQALTRNVFLSESGFRGASGAFRFRQDGNIERLFEISQLKDGKINRISAAPNGF